MKNWIYKHDLLTLSEHIGEYLGAYYEFTPQEGQAVKYSPAYFCEKCQQLQTVMLPTKENREKFGEQLKDVLRGAPSDIAPSLRHFWYHARCAECGADLILMRS